LDLVKLAAWGEITFPFDNHVGDIEHIDVRVVNYGWNLFEIYIAAHNFGEHYVYNQLNNEFVSDRGTGNYAEMSGLHPIAYAAKGSHGLWNGGGDHTYETLANGDSLVDETDQGIEWDTWNNIVEIAFKKEYGYTGNQQWLNYQGEWGNNEEGCEYSSYIGNQCVLNSGPDCINRRGELQDCDDFGC